MVFISEGFLEAATENWSEWGFNPPSSEFRSDDLTDRAIMP